ncbi:MAG: histidinol-phosphate aminotransferase [Actinomycetota bacterium]|nr:histidinol-phosphate aminotransferase [Actinomycetota bacterium]
MSDRVPLSIRADLEDVEPYVSPQLPARYRLNTNESPYAPPDALVEDVAAGLRDATLTRYPDRDAKRLYSAISKHVEWPVDGLWVANGSNEVFMHLFLGFGGTDRKTLLFEPTYSLHSLIPKIASTRVIRGGRDETLHIDLDRALEVMAAEKPEIVIVCSPNNPTGDCEPKATVEALLAAADGIVVVDEAYAEFADASDSVRPLLKEHDNLVVTKTFSKAWRLAGVRIGYMLAQPALIAELARVRLPYHLSTITQVIGEAAIEHSDETLRLVDALIEQRDRVALALAEMGLKVYPSKANFVLFEIEDADRVWKELLEREVLVRNYSGVHRLENTLRVTAGLPEEMDAFLTTLEEVI